MFDSKQRVLLYHWGLLKQHFWLIFKAHSHSKIFLSPYTKNCAILKTFYLYLIRTRIGPLRSSEGQTVKSDIRFESYDNLYSPQMLWWRYEHFFFFTLIWTGIMPLRSSEIHMVKFDIRFKFGDQFDPHITDVSLRTVKFDVKMCDCRKSVTRQQRYLCFPPTTSRTAGCVFQGEITIILHVPTRFITMNAEVGSSNSTLCTDYVYTFFITE